MGFRQSTSIRVMPGVRVRVSAAGISAYAGRTRIAGSAPARARSGPQPRRTARVAPKAPTQAPKPGVFSPKEERALYAFFVSRKDVALDPSVMMQPVHAQTAFALMGLQFLASGNMVDCIHPLQNALAGPQPLESNNFIHKYFPNYQLDLDIAGGLSAQLPVSTDAIRLALAEALQSQGRLDEAILCVEHASPTYPALLSLTELYSAKQDWSEVVRMTDYIEVGSEIGALLAILRSEAHLNLGQLTAAKECLKPITASKKYSENLRFQALALRSNISLEEKAYGRAIADLEKILAENSRVPGILQALEAVNAAKAESEDAKLQSSQKRLLEAEQVREAKKAETLRLREEKAAQALRLREEKAAEALRVREEKAAAKLAARNAPVMQTGIINLSDDAHDTAESEAAAARDCVAEPASSSSATREPGFHPDPEGVAPFRYWDGNAWTSRIRMTL